MAIFEVWSEAKGKCITCAFYGYRPGERLVGYCCNPYAKVKKRNRYYNSKICINQKTIHPDFPLPTETKRYMRGEDPFKSNRSGGHNE